MNRLTRPYRWTISEMVVCFLVVMVLVCGSLTSARIEQAFTEYNAAVLAAQEVSQ